MEELNNLIGTIEDNNINLDGMYYCDLYLKEKKR